MKQMAAQKPIARIRAGTVACALWENEINMDGTTKTVLKASVERRYKDRDGKWKSSGSFGRNEIPLAIFCLARAFDRIVQEETGKGSGEGQEEMTS